MRTCLQFFVGLLVFVSAASAALTCAGSAVPAVVSSEGLTERLGDVVLSCSGGTPSQAVAGNLTLFLSVNITNRTAADGRTDVALTVDNGSAPAPPPVYATAFSAFAVAFNALSFSLSASGGATVRITNLRGAVAQQGPDDPRPITVSIAFNGPLPIANTTLSVGLPLRGLLSSSSSTTIYCVGSPAPSALTVSAFLAAGTAFYSTRFTEGWAGAFEKRAAGSDTGTRLIARYSGFPAGARLFVPEFLAGSNALQPTAGGDLGLPPSGGQYTGGSGTLLVALVRLTDAAGGGGVLSGQAPPSGVTAAFDTAVEVPLVNGAGVAVYEVLDANPAQRESVQFPAFVVYTPPEGGSTAQGRQEVGFAPLSAAATGNANSPIPRYASVAPPSDCPALGDCNASYFPRLLVDAPPLEFKAPAGSGFQIQYIRINNEGGGILSWTVSVNYRTGSGWLRLFPMAGQNNATVRVDVLPEKLTPGVYEADLTIDAGPLAGSRTLRLRLEVTAFVPLPPAVRSAVNAATFEVSPLVAGSLGTLFGSRFTGRDLAVTFDGLPARVLFFKDDQINLQVPAALRGRTVAQVVVTVDGVASAPFAVSLAPFAPGIFGTLNQDFTVNGPNNPAPAGTVIQVFATGLPEEGSATILARIHDLEPELPLYAGPAPGFPGVQQVNARIADYLPAMTTDVRLCAQPPGRPAERVCSPPSRITLR
jgi:uncharacterized protein (TIGR03437 family)